MPACGRPAHESPARTSASEEPDLARGPALCGLRVVAPHLFQLTRRQKRVVSLGGEVFPLRADRRLLAEFLAAGENLEERHGYGEDGNPAAGEDVGRVALKRRPAGDRDD